MGRHRSRSVMVGLGSVALTGLIASPAAGQVQPSATAEAVCANPQDFSVRGRAAGFPPNVNVAGILHINETRETYNFSFAIDGDGNGVTSAVYASSVPYSAWSLDFRDDNLNGLADPGEPLIFAGTFTVANPCQDAPLAPK